MQAGRSPALGFVVNPQILRNPLTQKQINCDLLPLDYVGKMSQTSELFLFESRFRRSPNGFYILAALLTAKP